MTLNISDVSREKRRPGNPQWLQGKSGNPGGRYRDSAGGSAEKLAREYTGDAIYALILALRRPQHAVSAAVALLDRGWGKPKQSIEGDITHTNVHLHLLAAQTIAAELRALPQTPPTICIESDDERRQDLNTPPSE